MALRRSAVRTRYAPLTKGCNESCNPFFIQVSVAGGGYTGTPKSFRSFTVDRTAGRLVESIANNNAALTAHASHSNPGLCP